MPNIRKFPNIPWGQFSGRKISGKNFFTMPTFQNRKIPWKNFFAIPTLEGGIPKWIFPFFLGGHP